MTYGRRRSRKDLIEDAIVKALEYAGVEVWVIERPSDILTLYRERWLPLEIKTPKGGKYRPRADQKEQTDMLCRTKIPVVTTPIEALKAVGCIL